MESATANRRRRSLLVLAGAALALPPRRATAATVKRVGVLGIGVGGIFNYWKERFPKEFAALGWIEGRNLELVWFPAVGTSDPNREFSNRELRDLSRQRAIEMAAAGLDCMVANGEPHARMLHEASQAIPIVVNVPDPVGSGFAKSVARPGGNMTGLHDGEEASAIKEIELLRRLVPAASCLAWIGPENFRPSAVHLESAARSAGLRFRAITVNTADEPSLARLHDEIAALRREGCTIAHGQSMSDGMTTTMTRAALQHRIALAGGVRTEGFLLRYDASRGTEDSTARRVPAIVARILRGEKPGEIPFEGPSRYSLSVNLVTAARLGITMPPDVLVMADQVIR
jgi:putative ABC transport system substrate-binding protein